MALAELPMRLPPGSANGLLPGFGHLLPKEKGIALFLSGTGEDARRAGEGL